MKDHPDCYQRKVQKPALMVWGFISAHGMGDLHIRDGIGDILPSRRRLFPENPCLFQQDIARLHSAGVTTVWLCRHRVRVLDRAACSPDPIENVWRAS